MCLARIGTSQRPYSVDLPKSSFLQVRSTRLREVKEFAQGHVASKWWSQDSKPVFLDSFHYTMLPCVLTCMHAGMWNW